MAEFLLINGANVHAIDFNGKTALHNAVYLGNHQLVASLLDHGADINAVNVRGIPRCTLQFWQAGFLLSGYFWNEARQL
ncbi:hypothetical protein BJX62DRAFT_198972, partial [Aspergillus germanicus]